MEVLKKIFEGQIVLLLVCVLLSVVSTIWIGPSTGEGFSLLFFIFMIVYFLLCKLVVFVAQTPFARTMVGKAKRAVASRIQGQG